MSWGALYGQDQVTERLVFSMFQKRKQKSCSRCNLSWVIPCKYVNIPDIGSWKLRQNFRKTWIFEIEIIPTFVSGDIHNLNSVGIKVRLKINDLNYWSSSCKIIFLRMKEMQFWLINSLYRKKDKIYDLRKYRVSSKEQHYCIYLHWVYFESRSGWNFVLQVDRKGKSWRQSCQIHEL